MTDFLRCTRKRRRISEGCFRQLSAGGLGRGTRDTHCRSGPVCNSTANYMASSGFCVSLLEFHALLPVGVRQRDRSRTPLFLSQSFVYPYALHCVPRDSSSRARSISAHWQGRRLRVWRVLEPSIRRRFGHSCGVDPLHT